MKTITMTETRFGSPDGIAVNSYLEGETYTVPAELADIFTENGWADETDAPAPALSEAERIADGLLLCSITKPCETNPARIHM